MLFDIIRSPATGSLFLLLISSASLPAQIRASWPAPNVDVGTYSSVDQCTGAVTRVDSSSVERLVVKDTLPLGVSDVLGSLPTELIMTAKRCVAKYSADQVDMNEAVPWIKLYLQAGMDNEAMRVVQRRRTSLPQEQDSVNQAKRVKVLSDLAKAFLSAVPARLATGASLVAELQQINTPATWRERLSAALLQLSVARIANDTTHARQAAGWAVSIPVQLSEGERQTSEYQSSTQGIARAQHYLAHSAEIDSLRKSTAAYVALRRSLAEQISMTEQRIGTKAPQIRGDFWFPSDHKAPIPSPGRVTLILAQGEQEAYLKGHETGAMFRRLKKQFPEIDIVVARYTKGFFWNTEPPPPAREAQYLQELFQSEYGFPGILAVENTAFWRLPAPDRRRINTPTSNFTAYGDHFWLIDPDGVIIYYLPTIRSLRPFERDIADFIAVLLQR